MNPTYVNPNAAMQTQGLNAPAPAPIAGTPFTPSQQIAAQAQNAAAQNIQAPGSVLPTIGATNINPQTGVQNTPPPAAPTLTPEQQMANKYQTGLANAKASGEQPPTSSGDASAAVSGLTPPTPEPTTPSPIENQLKNDPGYQQLLQDQKDYLSSQNQTQSLQDTYTKLTQDAGIPALDTQLINMKSIMDGTEGDIRNEITKAGGFATESQVLALTSARNKTMIQNYNNLLNTKTDLENHIDKTMGFAEQDRTQATALAAEKMSYDKQIMDYTQKFTSAAQDSLKGMQATEGWDGIYKAALASGDPNAINRINQTMGNGFDIRTMALADAQTKANALAQQQLAQQKTVADIANTKANTTNTQANTNKTNIEASKIKNTIPDDQPDPKRANQPTYNDQGVKYTVATAASDVKALIKSSGLTGTRNLLDPNNYNYLKSWWVQQGLPDASFDSVFGGMKDPGLASKKVYN